MKSTEILNIFENFLDNRHTPSEEGVHYGCTCGCGGDFYALHPEYWDEAHNIVYKYRAELKEVLDKLGIEINTPELMDNYDSEDDW